MIRAITAAMLLLIASPLFAEAMSEAELEALFNKWQAEENRTLEGWRVLDDINLIEKLAPWASKMQSRDGRRTVYVGPKEALGLLGVMHWHGVGGAPEDVSLAKRYLKATNDLYFEGLIEVQFTVLPSGRFEIEDYSFGEAIEEGPQDFGREPAGYALSALAYLKWFDLLPPRRQSAYDDLEKAARRGCLPAQVYVARALYRGAGLKRDVSKAHNWLELAAKEEYLPAFMELADFHHPRNGVRPDLHLYRTELSRAVALGNYVAAEELRRTPLKPLEELTVSEMYEEYTKSWGKLKEDKTDRLAAVLRFEPNRFLSYFDDIATRLRPVADTAENAGYTRTEIAYAQCMLGECRLHGVGGVDRDEKEALSLLRSAWLSHDLAAAGLLYGIQLANQVFYDKFGLGEAVLMKVVDTGFKPAVRFQVFASLDWLSLGYAGLGNERLRLDDPEAELEKLARSGDPEALEAMRYRSSHIRWKHLAAEAEIPWAMLAYADVISRGDVSGATSEDATELYKRCLLFAETHGRAKEVFDYRAARPAAKRALAYETEIEKALNSGMSYEQVLKRNRYMAGVAQKSFEAGYSTGVVYAICLRAGHGITQDLKLARKILLGYTESPIAVFFSGRDHEERGDVREAIWCYEAAANVGAGYASYRLGVIYREGKLKDKDDEAGTKWFIKGAEDGCVVAMLEAAKAYHGGVGVDADAEKAIEWAKKAADAGNDDAQGLLDEWNK